MKLLFIVCLGYLAFSASANNEVEQTSDKNLPENQTHVPGSVIRGRIAYGYRAYPGQYPFAAWLNMLGDGGGMIVCGGTLVSSTFVVTAAHCINFSFRGLDVYLGSIDRNSFPTKRTANMWVKHPYYEAPASQNAEHDIAMVRMSASVTETPAFLPPRWSTAANYQGQTMITAGWGGTENGGLSQFLLFTQVVGTDISGCGSIRSDKVICARGVFEKSENRGGDSGGPLLTDGKTLIGVVSFGWGGHNGYTRVDRYIDWIVGFTGVNVQ